jgi:hypothetical protein
MEDLLPELYDLVCRELRLGEGVMLALTCKRFYRIRPPPVAKQAVARQLLSDRLFSLFVWWRGYFNRHEPSLAVSEFVSACARDGHYAALRAFLVAPGNPYMYAHVWADFVKPMGYRIAQGLRERTPVPAMEIESAFRALGVECPFPELIHNVFRFPDGCTLCHFTLPFWLPHYYGWDMDSSSSD